MRLEAAFAFCAGAPQRMEQAGGRVFALEIARDFAAEKSAGDGVGGIAAELAAAACFVDVDQEGTGVRAIERADGMACFSHL